MHTMCTFTSTDPLQGNEMALGDRQTKCEQEWQGKNISYWKVSHNLKKLETSFTSLQVKDSFMGPHTLLSLSSIHRNGGCQKLAPHCCLRQSHTDLFVTSCSSVLSLFSVLIITPVLMIGKFSPSPSSLLVHYFSMFIAQR